jgi:DNA-binding Lrp family transcriptional regulator
MAHRTVPNSLQLDAIAWKILEALQHNARSHLRRSAGWLGCRRRPLRSAFAALKKPASLPAIMPRWT